MIVFMASLNSSSIKACYWLCLYQHDLLDFVLHSLKFVLVEKGLFRSISSYMFFLASLSLCLTQAHTYILVIIHMPCYTKPLLIACMM